MPKSFVVVGTDTSAGKTVVCAGLFLGFRALGLDVGIQKWVSTGDPFGFSNDVQFVLDTAGLDRDYFPGISERHLNPYSFVYPASPHFSSRLVSRRIDLKEIRRLWYEYASLMDVLIVEGVGGVMVPLDERHLLIDVIKDMKLPVVVVIRNTLGAINHSLLTVSALKTRGIKVLGLIFNDAFGCNMDIKKDNVGIIQKLSGVKSLGIVPYMSSIRDYESVFKDMAKRLLRRL